MLLSLLLIIPLIGIFIISNTKTYTFNSYSVNTEDSNTLKSIALSTASINLIISFIIYYYLILVVINFSMYKNIIISKFWYLFRCRWYIYIFCIINNYNNAYSYYYLIEIQ